MRSSFIRPLILTFCVLLLVAVTGCVLAYKTLADERDARTILTDTNLKATIVEAYIADKLIKNIDFFTACYYGNVFLVGEYNSVEEKDRAIEIARSYEGVKLVIPYLLPKQEVEGCGPGENLRIAATVKGRLINDFSIHSTNVDVKSVQCTVVLLGVLGKDEEALRVVEHAKGVQGIEGIISLIKTVR